MSFHQFAEEHGLLIKSLKASDKIQRCPTLLHPRSTNGAYLFDGERGGVFAWDGEGRWHWYKDPNAKPWTEEEKRQWAMKRQNAEADRERDYVNAALKADMTLRSCVLQQHGYLAAKGFPLALGRVDADGQLLIPMHNYATYKIVGLQRIFQEDHKWQKKMIGRMRAKGAILRLGQATAGEKWFCEGYATGLSLRAALDVLRLNACVWVCFSDSNMLHVAVASKGVRFVFADNDASEAGQRAASATNLPWCMSPNVGEDANDYHQKHGVYALAKIISDCRMKNEKL
jgi:phage/plasmid primase-like uncharacterized protein